MSGSSGVASQLRLVVSPAGHSNCRHLERLIGVCFIVTPCFPFPKLHAPDTIRSEQSRIAHECFDRVPLTEQNVFSVFSRYSWDEDAASFFCYRWYEGFSILRHGRKEGRGCTQRRGGCECCFCRTCDKQLTEFDLTFSMCASKVVVLLYFAFWSILVFCVFCVCVCVCVTEMTVSSICPTVPWACTF